MAFWEHFPYTNFHEINLDWLCKTAKKNEERSNEAVKTAEAAKNYVENLNVQTEVNRKIDSLYDEGLLGDSLTQQYYSYNKNVALFGDSYGEGLSPFLEEAMGEVETFRSWAVGGSALMNRDGFSSLTQQLNSMLVSGYIPDIVIMLFGANDALVMSSDQSVDRIGVFSTNNFNNNTSMGCLCSAVSVLTELNPKVKICFVPTANLRETSDGYYKLAATALQTQIDIVHFWRNFSVLWETDITNIDWNFSQFWTNAHPTVENYTQNYAEKIKWWIRFGAENRESRLKTKAIITTSPYNFVDFLNSVRTRLINATNINGNVIGRYLSGFYSYLPIGGGNLDYLTIVFRAFGSDFDIYYHDVNGTKFVQAHYDREIASDDVKQINWS